MAYFRAYFSLQYCTLCAVLVGKFAVLNVKVCSIEILKISSSKANELEDDYMKHRITWLYEVLKDYPQPSCFFFTLKHEPGARRNSLCPPPPRKKNCGKIYMNSKLKSLKLFIVFSNIRDWLF